MWRTNRDTIGKRKREQRSGRGSIPGYRRKEKEQNSSQKRRPTQKEDSGIRSRSQGGRAERCLVRCRKGEKEGCELNAGRSSLTSRGLPTCLISEFQEPIRRAQGSAGKGGLTNRAPEEGDVLPSSIGRTEKAVGLENRFKASAWRDCGKKLTEASNPKEGSGGGGRACRFK